MHAASQLWSIVWNFFKSYGVPKWIFADHRASKNLLDFVIDYSNCQMGPIWWHAVTICRDIFWLCFMAIKKQDAPLFGILSKVRGIRVQKLRSLGTNSIYSLDEAIDAIWQMPKCRAYVLDQSSVQLPTFSTPTGLYCSKSLLRIPTYWGFLSSSKWLIKWTKLAFVHKITYI